MAHSNSVALGVPVGLTAGVRGVDVRVVTVALALFGVGTFYLQATIHWRQATLFLLGGVLGLFLYHAEFGFTSAWRVFISDRRGRGLRAQMLMQALACALFFPVLDTSAPILGLAVRGNVNPLGVAVAAGAFLFGVGMQVSGGCASGTLFAVGGGNARMLVTLFGFIAGSVLGAAHAPWWQALPALPPVSLVGSFGAGTALVMSLSLFAAIAGATRVLERRRHGRLLPPATSSRGGWERVLQGPWPLVAGAIGLAIANFSTLVLAGRPWGITSGFALWGSKVVAMVGVDVASWEYWSVPARAASLDASVFENVTSVMDFGIMLGALGAAGFAGRFAPAWSMSVRSRVAALIGGLLLGYGARLAYGCNIGAYFSVSHQGASTGGCGLLPRSPGVSWGPGCVRSAACR